MDGSEKDGCEEVDSEEDRGVEAVTKEDGSTEDVTEERLDWIGTECKREEVKRKELKSGS